MRQVITRTALTGAGAIGGLIGGALMFMPKAFLEMSHVFVERDPSLMSEITAPSGVLLICAAFLIFGAIKLRFARQALLIGAVVYGSYGIARLMSMVLHGLPSESLVAAMVVEIAIAVLLGALGLTARSHPHETTADADRIQVSA